MRRSLNTPLFVFAGFLASIGFFASTDGARAQLTCTDPDFAAGTCTGEADFYEFTVKAFKLRRTDNDETVDLTPGEKTFNAASVTAGADVGEYASGAAIDATEYDEFIVILGKTMSVRGSVTTDDARPCRTFTTGSADDGGTAENISENIPSQFLNADDDAEFTATQTELPDDLPLTVGEGQGVNIRIAFDVGSGVLYTFSASSPFNCTAADLGPLGVNMSLIAE